MEQRIVERPRQHRHRPERHGVHERIDFPEAEVAGKKQRSLAGRMGRAHALFPFERHARQHGIRRHRAEFQEDGQQPAEVREHAAGDCPALGLAPQRKGRLQVAHRQPPVRPIEPVERAADDRADREHRGHRQKTHARHHGDDGQVLEAVPE